MFLISALVVLYTYGNQVKLLYNKVVFCLSSCFKQFLFLQSVLTLKIPYAFMLTYCFKFLSSLTYHMYVIGLLKNILYQPDTVSFQLPSYV